MGIMKRLRETPKGIKEAIDDIFGKGILGGVISTGQRFSQKNAEAFSTLGEDIKR